jgi:hypothetical protein
MALESFLLMTAITLNAHRSIGAAENLAVTQRSARSGHRGKMAVGTVRALGKYRRAMRIQCATDVI